MAGRFNDPDKIIELLAELKTKTPEYPADLMVARKTAFMEQVVSINIQPKGPGSESGGGSGGGGSGLTGGSGFFGGMSSLQGILLQATIGVWIIAAMLTAAYVFRDQIIDLFQGNGTVEITQPGPALVPPVTDLPSTEAVSTEIPPTEPSPASVDLKPEVELGPDGIPVETVNAPNAEATPGAPSVDPYSVQGTSDDDPKDNKGKKIGVTPGSPDVPGKGEPDTPNKPNPHDDKPGNENPSLPDKSNKNNKNINK